MNQFKPITAALALAILLLPAFVQQSPAQESDKKSDETKATSSYLVVSFVDKKSDYYAAAELLAKRHNCRVVQANAEKIPDLLKDLKSERPDSVAFVVKPNDLDINFVQDILLMATQVDSDPFIDFAYGMITGKDGKAAVKLVESSGKTNKRKPEITMFGVGSAQMGKSRVQKSVWPLRNKMIPMTSYTSVGDSDEKRDEGFISESLPKLDKPSILILASHGYPDGLVGGPKAKDLDKRDFTGAVSLNIACYNGVTDTWYEDDWATMKVKQRHVSAENSFCLKMIDNGIAGYVAYLCPRPAGPTMFGDAMFIASSGKSLGEIQQASANSVVLAHLMTGEKQVRVDRLSDGDVIKPGRTPGQIVKKLSTGGVLFGDPAYRPFEKLENTNPITVNQQVADDRITVGVKVQTPTYHFYTSEQVNYWEGKAPAFRLETIVPIEDRVVSDVRVLESPSKQYRYVAAVEHDHGKRYLRFKMTFPQPKDFKKLQQWAVKGISGKFEIITSAESADVKTADGRIITGRQDSP